MIPLLDPAHLLAGYLLTASATCAPAPAPTVEMSFTNNPPTVNNGLGSPQLAQIPLDTKLAHKRDEIFITRGLTVTDVEPEYHLAFDATKNTGTGEICMWLKDIKLSVTYSPEIYIASEYAPDSCQYHEVFEHELKHVNMMVITITQYLPRIQKAIGDEAATIGAVSLPNESFLDGGRKAMGERIATKARALADEMYKANLVYQQSIDTRQEYARVAHACD